MPSPRPMTPWHSTSSGASMSVAYAWRFRRGYPISKYLALRYVRLAPLYAAVTTYSVLFHRRDLYDLGGLVGRWLLNVTFLFGLTNPGDTSLVIGGWSLGIEFVFYLTFPLILAVVSGRRGLLWVAVVMAAQLVFVNIVLAGHAPQVADDLGPFRAQPRPVAPLREREAV